MGKKQHQKDKLYLTATEWSTIYGGKKAAGGGGKGSFKKLPFYCCSLSLQPFEDPVATPEGVVFDSLQIVPYLNKHGISPVTGQPIEVKNLIKICYHKNSDGQYHCPVTYKIFNEHSHIVAIRTTGNVYSYEAVEHLNIKPSNMRDLLTDEKFLRTDILTLQDPAHPEKWDVSTFHYVKNRETDEQQAGKSSAVRHMNPETKATLESLVKEFPVTEGHQSKEDTKSVDVKPEAMAHYSTGKVSTGFTSTVIVPHTTNEAATIDHSTLLYQMVDKKAYVRLKTTLGDLNLEVHCDLVPVTCHNFIQLCKHGYYNKTIFHRSIKNFMIQGGDPLGTGSGGQSVWKKDFKDEFKPNLTHSGRGVLSMANSGPSTNRSQFFITYRSCRHLDGKHTVFGRLVGGLEVLTAMEGILTDKHDKPKEDIIITGCSVFVDPYEEAELKMAASSNISDVTPTSTLNTSVAAFSEKPELAGKTTVGKYIQKPGSGVKRKSKGTETTVKKFKQL